MPTYEYECNDCGIRFERKQSMLDEPIRVCPECDGSVRRVLFPVGIVFKGSGFYVTDNRSGSAHNGQSKPTQTTESNSETSGSEDKAVAETTVSAAKSEATAESTS